MFDLKTTAVSVLALTSSAVFAGSMGSMGAVCAPGNVTVPCEKSAWAVGVSALYLRPGLSNDMTYYNDIHTTTVDTSKSYDKWDWGFKLQGSYFFNTGNDVTVNWYHLDTDDNYTSTNNLIASRVEMKWDAVNLEVGQYSDFGANQKMRFHGGATYARINSSNLDTFDNTTTYPSTWSSEFKGFGPRVGIDMAYPVSSSFDLYAKGAAAVLLGSGKFSTFDENFERVYGSRNTVVPELDAKLGAAFTHCMSNGDFTVDAGWMLTNYFQAQHRSNLSCDANFSVNGPYIGLNYVGNL